MTRFEEHIGICFRIGQTLSIQTFSSTRDRGHQCGYVSVSNSFSVMHKPERRSNNIPQSILIKKFNASTSDYQLLLKN